MRAAQALSAQLEGAAHVFTCTGDTTAVDKAAVVSTFCGETNLPVVVVGTSAFGAGIDSPEVVMVAHLGGAWGFSQLLQEAGRAGRDGKVKAQHVVYTDKHHVSLLQRQADGLAPPPTSTNPRPPLPDSRQQRHAKLLLLYLHERTACRRLLIDNYLGGAGNPGRVCLHEPGFALCDHCQAAFEAAGLAHQSDSDEEGDGGFGSDLLDIPGQSTDHAGQVMLRRP